VNIKNNHVSPFQNTISLTYKNQKRSLCNLSFLNSTTLWLKGLPLERLIGIIKCYSRP